MFNKYPEQVWEFETLHQAISGEQNEEEAEAAVAEAVLNFDLSTLWNLKAKNKKNLKKLKKTVLLRTTEKQKTIQTKSIV